MMKTAMKNLDLMGFGTSGKSFNDPEWVILRQIFRNLDVSYQGKWMREAEKPASCGAKKRDLSFAEE